MTYGEFKEQYRWMVRNYPGTTTFCGMLEKPVGVETKTTYEKVGRKWKAVRVESEEISGMYYCNAIDAIPFFRNLGGRENVTMAYTYNGYIPVEVSSISPDKQRKTVRKYSFYK